MPISFRLIDHILSVRLFISNIVTPSLHRPQTRGEQKALISEDDVGLKIVSPMTERLQINRSVEHMNPFIMKIVFLSLSVKRGTTFLFLPGQGKIQTRVVCLI